MVMMVMMIYVIRKRSKSSQYSLHVVETHVKVESEQSVGAAHVPPRILSGDRETRMREKDREQENGNVI